MINKFKRFLKKHNYGPSYLRGIWAYQGTQRGEYKNFKQIWAWLRYYSLNYSAVKNPRTQFYTGYFDLGEYLVVIDEGIIEMRKWKN